MSTNSANYIVLAGGCFWGMEQLIKELPGVIDTEVGYSGGSNSNPNYYNHPGHAEAIKVTYDQDKLPLADLLDYFFKIHDPTTINRQGNDIGESYRSCIFVKDSEQKTAAEAAIDRINQKHIYDRDAVTSIEPLTKFWPAEDYHQDYLYKNPGGYTCHFLREG